MKRPNLHFLSILLAVVFLLSGTGAWLTLLLSSAAGIPSSFYFYLAVSFLSGATALILALTVRNEVIVYRERKDENRQTDEQQRHDHTASLNSKLITESVRKARTTADAAQQFLQSVAGQLQAGAGAFYRVHRDNGTRTAVLEAGYAIPVSEKNRIAYEAGEGLVGQLIVTGKTVYLDELPEGYIKIISGLGSASPRYVFICPVLKDNEVVGAVELASFTPLTPAQRKQVEEACQIVAEKM
ncbi:MAG: GAF domain-containing protein [Cyclobacteriaceae bacterium]|nr:GAF domain-containing protein [Cyclobacteriaceae bacterium]MCX7636381.1 GAF domain-containing protein [Cyclobacteriaceae bacterium]